MTLPTRPLGRTGIDVSVLGLGTVAIGRSTGLRYPKRVHRPSDTDASALIDAAVVHGVTLLDTAPAYGDAETRLGHLLKGRRDQFVLVTKTGEAYDGRRSSFDFSRDATLLSIERSLRALGTDCLDCVLLHSDGRDEARLVDTGALEALHARKQAGDIRAVGASTKTLPGLRALAPYVDVLMVTLGDAEDVEAAQAAASAHGCGILVKKALDSGFAEDRPRALQSASAHAFVSSVVVGTINPAHLAANARAIMGT